MFDRIDHVLAALDLSKNGVLPIEPVGDDVGDEELAAIRIGAGVCHREFASFVELVGRTLSLVFELITGTAKAGACRISALEASASVIGAIGPSTAA